MTPRSPLQDLYGYGDDNMSWDEPDPSENTWQGMGLQPFQNFMPFPGMPPYAYPRTWMGDDWSDAESSDQQTMETESEQPETAEKSVTEVSAADSELDELLAAYKQKYAEEIGEALDPQLVDIINKIWQHGRNMETFKKILAKHPWPENLVCQKVEVNPEVLTSISKFGKTRDAKLRSVQGCLTRVVVTFSKVAQAAVGKEVNKKELLEISIDAIILISNADEVTNQLRCDSLKSGMAL